MVLHPAAPVRLAIVGTGAAAAVHADAAAAAGIAVTALVGRSRRSGRDLAESTGARVLRLEDLPGAADVVLVATDPPTHGPLGARLLDLGLPVLVERPLAASPAAAGALADRGARAADNLRYAPLVRAVLDRGLPPVDVEVRVHRPRPGWGFWAGTPPLTGLLVDLVATGVAVALDALGEPVDAAVLLAEAPSAEAVRLDLRVARRRARVDAAWSAAPLVDLQVAGDGFVSRAELLPRPGLELDGVEATGSHAGRGADGSTPDPLDTLGYVDQLRRVLPELHAARPGSPAADRSGVDVVRVLAAVLESLRTGTVVKVGTVSPATPLVHVRR